ncbi:MAG: serine--tRNA ligase, partial [Jatrophihabitans sp.]
MIDLKALRENPERARASQRLRGADPALVDALLAADEARRAAIARADALRAEQRAVSRSVAQAAPDDRPTVLARARELSEQVRDAESAQAGAEAALRAAHLAVPNVVEDGVPPGGEDDFVTLETVGAVPRVAAPREHTAIGEALGAIDMARGAKVSGARFYFLTGVGAQD